MKVELEIVRISIPDSANIIIGQSHFIKTVEDIYEAVVGAVPSIKFGIAFCEASGECLIRSEGNDEELIKTAQANALSLGCGHTFNIILKDGYPINILNQIKNIPEVCRIFCATANPVEAIVVNTKQGRGLLGVVDGFMPKGIEQKEDIQRRRDLLRKFKYKL